MNLISTPFRLIIELSATMNFIYWTSFTIWRWLKIKAKSYEKLMNKSAIKILKKDKKEQAENLRSSTVSAKDETNNQFNVAQTINFWIAERRENRRAERAASANKIASWR